MLAYVAGRQKILTPSFCHKDCRLDVKCISRRLDRQDVAWATHSFRSSTDRRHYCLQVPECRCYTRKIPTYRWHQLEGVRQTETESWQRYNRCAFKVSAKRGRCNMQEHTLCCP